MPFSYAVLSSVNSDTGSSASDRITQDRSLVLTGVAAPSGVPSTLGIWISGGQFGSGALVGTTTFSADAGTQQSWSVDLTGVSLTDDVYRVWFTDGAASDAPTVSGITDFTVDNVAPGAPTIAGYFPDSGVSGSDGYLTYSPQTGVFEGTAERGATVTLLLNGSALASGTADGSGKWVIPVALQAGSGNVTAIQADRAGNSTGAQSNTFTVTVDAVSPTLTSFAPSDSTPANSDVVHYVISFSEPVFGLRASDFSVATIDGEISGLSVLAVTEVAGSDGQQYSVAVATGSGDGTISLLLNNQNLVVADRAGNLMYSPTFGGPSQQASAGPSQAIAVGDFNGDERGDFVVANSQGASISVHLSGRSTQAVGVQANPRDIAIGDLNNDGKPDVVTYGLGSSQISVLIGNGDGTFQTPAGYGAGTPGNSVVLEDVNADGWLDAIVGGIYGPKVLLGDGAGHFGAPLHLQDPGYAGYRDVVVADVNADGRKDIVSFQENAPPFVYLQQSGGFAYQYTFALNGTPSFFATTADLDADGRLEILAADGNRIVIWGYDQSGVLRTTPSVYTLPGSAHREFTVADVNGDGILDIASVTESRYVVVLMGLGDGAFKQGYVSSAPISGYATWSIGAGDVTGDGRTDLIIPDSYTGLVTTLGNQAAFSVTSGGSYVIDRAPAIAGVEAKSVDDTEMVALFSGVTLGEGEAAATITVTVTFDSAGSGAFTAASLAASGFASGIDGSSGEYSATYTGSPAAATAAIRILQYRPAENYFTNDVANAVTFAVTTDDGTQTASVTETLQITAVNDAPTFDVGDGIATTAVGIHDDIGRSVTLQPDGKILVAGYSYSGSNQEFALTRYNADGSLDASFGDNGKVVTAISPYDDYAYDIKLQSDGKILVAGRAYNGSNDDIAIVRYNSDGALDSTFGNAGKIVSPFTGYDQAFSLSLQADGKIVVAGMAPSGIGSAFALARYDADGALDTEFGIGGIATAGSGWNNYAYDIAIQPNGNIVVVGESGGGFSSGYGISLLRFNAAGVLDSTFGTNGIVYGGSSDGDWASLALQPDGKILVASTYASGPSWNTNYNLSLSRYNPDGSVDNSFGSAGVVTTDIGWGDRSYDVTLQPDGKIVVVGSSANSIALVRYNTDGALDTDFGGDGIVTTAAGSSYAVAYSVALQHDGKIVVAGYAYNNATGNDFALVRYNTDGSLDATFGPDNSLNGAPTYIENGAPVALDSDVAILDAELVAAGNYAGATLTLVRDGGADPQDIFGATGALAALTEGGDLVVSGISIGAVTQNSGGTLILAFNANATETLVNSAMRGVTYANTSDNPPASVKIGWTFSDGNTGAQGTGGALTATGSTTVTITPVNDVPIANPVTVSGVEDQPGRIAIAFSGYDPDSSDSIESFRIESVPVGGRLFTAAVGGAVLSVGSEVAFGQQIFFQPDLPDFSGSTSFTYTAFDGAAYSGAATVLIEITPVNDAPVATAVDLGSIAEESTGRIITAAELLAGVSDTDGPSVLSITALSIATGGGSLIDNGDGTWSYTPAANDDTQVSFSYTASDGEDQVSGTASLNLTPVNDAPVATAVDLGSIAEDNTGRIITAAELLAGVSDGDGPSALSITALSIATGGGTLTSIDATSWRYVPAANDDTSVSFSYTASDGADQVSGTASLDLTPVNDAPIPSAVDLGGMAEDSTGRIITAAELLAGVSDIDGPSALSITALSIATGGGSLTDNGDGAWSYTPAANDDTSVTFSYTASDGEDQVSGTASLDLTPVNDAPIATAFHLGSIAEDSTGRIITAAELLAGVIDDDGPSALSITALSIATGNGTLTPVDATSWRYVPAANDDAQVSFSYTASDGADQVFGTASLDLTPVNDAPIATAVDLGSIAEDSAGRIITAAELLAGVSDGDGPSSLSIAALSIATGNGTLTPIDATSWRYVPAADDDTSVSFSYTVSDGADQVSGTAILDLTPVNDAPIATAVDLGSIAEDSTGRIITAAELLAGVSDIDGPSALSITALSIATGGGSLTDNGDGTWSYTPAANDDTSVTFSYTASDGEDQVSGTASLDLFPVDEVPGGTPEIGLSGNSRTIADNDETPSALDHTDFGSAAYAETPIVRTFTINNTGSGALNLSSVTVPNGFTLVDGFPTTIAAQSFATIKIRLDTDFTGTANGKVVITNNDEDESSFDFAILGRVTAEIRNGGDFDDEFLAGPHAESFDGGKGIDTVSYSNSAGAVTASLAATSGGYAAGDTFRSIENLRGSQFDDKLVGDHRDNVLEGGEGKNKLDGGRGVDTASYAHAESGVTASLQKPSVNTGDARDDSYKSIENLLGSAFDDVLIGDRHANKLQGGDGADKLTGNGGVDILIGGNGSDSFQFNKSSDGDRAAGDILVDLISSLANGGLPGLIDAIGDNFRFSLHGNTGDIIGDFVSGEDKIAIDRSGFGIKSRVDFGAGGNLDFDAHYFVSSAAFAGTNKSGVSATEYGHGQFLFNETTDQLWWDADGLGRKDPVLLATFANGAHVTASDFDLI